MFIYWCISIRIDCYIILFPYSSSHTRYKYSNIFPPSLIIAINKLCSCDIYSSVNNDPPNTFSFFYSLLSFLFEWNWRLTQHKYTLMTAPPGQLTKYFSRWIEGKRIIRRMTVESEQKTCINIDSQTHMKIKSMLM